MIIPNEQKGARALIPMYEIIERGEGTVLADYKTRLLTTLIDAGVADGTFELPRWANTPELREPFLDAYRIALYHSKAIAWEQRDSIETDGIVLVARLRRGALENI